MPLQHFLHFFATPDTGLRLVIVKNAVAGYGGTIAVPSQVGTAGQGTCFTAGLPLMAGAPFFGPGTLCPGVAR